MYSYLPDRLIYFYFFLLVLLFFSGSKFLFIICLIFGGFLFFIYRRKKEYIHDSIPSTQGVILSPINGIIKKIKKGVDHEFFGQNLVEIKIIQPFFQEVGLYLPLSCEVASYHLKKGQRYFHLGLRNEVQEVQEIKKESTHALDDNIQYGGICLYLQTRFNLAVGLQIVHCYFGGSPKVWIQTGDKGKIGANFGHIPFGGSVLMYLPADVGLLVQEGENVVARRTMLAGKSV